MAGTEADAVFGDVAGIILRHVQVGADEDACLYCLAKSIAQSVEFHRVEFEEGGENAVFTQLTAPDGFLAACTTSGAHPALCANHSNQRSSEE
jgi:hypothetical protein